MNPNRSIAAVLLAVKGVLGVWAGLVLMTTSPTDPRSFLGSEVHTRRTGLGLVILVLSVVTLLIAAAVIRWAPRAVPAALALSAAIVGLLLASRDHVVARVQV
ncbi:MAG: hypothetical protein QOG87_255 [Actinomycetota bacterium]|jgi:hypothetical protein